MLPLRQSCGAAAAHAYSTGLQCSIAAVRHMVTGQLFNAEDAPRGTWQSIICCSTLVCMQGTLRAASCAPLKSQSTWTVTSTCKVIVLACSHPPVTVCLCTNSSVCTPRSFELDTHKTHLHMAMPLCKQEGASYKEHAGKCIFKAGTTMEKLLPKILQLLQGCMESRMRAYTLSQRPVDRYSALTTYCLCTACAAWRSHTADYNINATHLRNQPQALA